MELQDGLTAVVVVLGDDSRLADCLAALDRECREVPLELVVVENAAQGPPPELPLRPALRLRRSANPGFAASVNEALARSSAPFVLSLNPDARLHPGSLQAARAALESTPRCGAVAFRLLRPGGRVLDSAGIRLGLVRRARDRGMGRPADGLYRERAPVDAACMACALFRREALLSARDAAGDVLDSRFFAYKEDVDLGWRLWRAGFSVFYEPAAVATHERGWKEGRRHRVPIHLRVLSLRNRWFTILKNESALSFAARMALYVPVEIALAFWLLLFEPRVLRAYPGVMRGVRECLRRRKLLESRT